MEPLDRLLGLVRRTGLPMMIPSEEGGEPCVLMPLQAYERLGRTSIPSTAKPTEPIEGPAPIPDLTLQSSAKKDTSPVLRLQDLLQESMPVTADSGSFLLLPEGEALEDRLAFDGLDIKIFSQTKQKAPTPQSSFDEFGPTLA